MYSRRSDEIIKFNTPATFFGESLPIGNGRLGAMIFGDRIEEQIVLNEATMWSGCNSGYDRKGAARYFPVLKNLLLAGKNREADEMYEKVFTSMLTPEQDYAGGRSTFGCYQTLGTLHISSHQNMSADTYSWYPQWSNARDYYERILELKTACVHMKYTANAVTFFRDAFASAPDQVIVLKYSASVPQSVSLTARLDRPEKFSISIDHEDLLMQGRLDNGIDGQGIRYACRVHVEISGGIKAVEGQALTVRNADEVILYIAAVTDMKSFQRICYDDPSTVTYAQVLSAAKIGYEKLLVRHKKDYQRYYKRAEIHLDFDKTTNRRASTPDRILESIREPEKKDLINLFVNYGKYLYISSNREGGLPCNLQGIWAQEVQTMFNGDWHLDAQQENHWMAEPMQLSELHTCYLNMIAFLQRNGSKTAREYYGAPGWIAHIFTNPWGFTSPGSKTFYGASMGGSGWLCQHLWDHYLFHPDLEYLWQIYPVMKGAAEFYLYVMFEEPEHHWLVTGPTNSPEHSYYTDESHNETASVCMGSTYDCQIIRFLFESCIEAQKILQNDPVFIFRLENALAQIPPTRINPDGMIAEWLKPYHFNAHRHISQLWGLYPGNEISPENSPELVKAAGKTIRNSLAATGGWALAFRINAAARLEHGEEAEKYLLSMLHKSIFPNMFGKNHQVLENNKKQFIPPFQEKRIIFQIDGNLACPAGVIEMLVQSHLKVIRNGKSQRLIKILPALPKTWKKGEVKNIALRGGASISISWSEGALKNVKVKTISPVSYMFSYRKRYSIEIAMKGHDQIVMDHQLHVVSCK